MLSLCDRTGKMCKPWAEDGYTCYAVDIDNDGDIENIGDGSIHYISADIHEYLPPREEYVFVSAFPPCTNLAVSGARWFKDKGLDGLQSGIKNVERCRKICEWSDAAYIIENPVSTLSTDWREPDYIFDPYEYDGYTEEWNQYSKKTCLGTSKSFVMPDTDGVKEYDDSYIHNMGGKTREEQAKNRSETPQGFANAVYEYNS